MRRKPHTQGLGKALPNKIPTGKMSAEANFGTVVESCSMKPTLSPSSFPFAPYTTEKCKIAKLPAIFLLPLTRMRRAFCQAWREIFLSHKEHRRGDFCNRRNKKSSKSFGKTYCFMCRYRAEWYSDFVPLVKLGLEQTFDYEKGRQHFLLSPLDCPTAKTGGAVNGGRSPFILPLTGSAGFAIFSDFIHLCLSFHHLLLAGYHNHIAPRYLPFYQTLFALPLEPAPWPSLLLHSQSTPRPAPR